MKNTITPEEHARIKRRRWRQTLGMLSTVLVLIGFITVLRAGVGLVANLFDDTAQKQEYEDKLEGLVLFDPMPFDGIENIDDLTLREAAVWGCVYSIQETQGGFDNYNTDPETEQLLLPSVEVDAYLAKLLGPGFKLTHRSFDMEDMTIEFDETTQCYKIPITGTVGYYRATVVKLFKRSGKLHVTVGYIPTASADRQHHQSLLGHPHQVYGLPVRAPERQLVSDRPDRERDQARKRRKLRCCASRSLWRKAMCRTPFWPLPEIPLRQIRLLPRLSSRKRRQKRVQIAPWQKPPPLRMPPAPQRKM